MIFNAYGITILQEITLMVPHFYMQIIMPDLKAPSKKIKL